MDFDNIAMLFEHFGLDMDEADTAALNFIQSDYFNPVEVANPPYQHFGQTSESVLLAQMREYGIEHLALIPETP